MSGAALGIGMAIQGYASYSKGIEQANAYGIQAQEKRATAAEVQIGADREKLLTQQAYARTRGAQITAFGQSGVSVSTGSPLAVLEQSASNAFDQISSIQQAASFRESTLLTDANQSDILAGEERTNAFLGILGAGIGAFSKNPYSYDSDRESAGTAGSSTGGSMITGDFAPSDYYGTSDYRNPRQRGNL